MTQIEPIKQGDEVPQFLTSDDRGLKVSSEELRGKKFLIYFYPKDNTPGCTTQACEFSKLYDKFKSAGITIIGISGGNLGSHQKFQKKYSIPFQLLLDEEYEIAKAFGVYGEKKFMGKVYQGIHRTSFLINEEGKVEKTYLKVRPKGHALELLNELHLLSNSR